MVDLVPCPLCGGEDGYALHSGSTYRWYYVHCVSCGEVVAECLAGEHRFDDQPPATRIENADEVWNQAGAYAEGLRVEVKRLKEERASLVDAISKDLDSLAEWEYCDCGCPNAEAPKDAVAVGWIRAAARVRTQWKDNGD